jgi:hypothetical protein
MCVIGVTGHRILMELPKIEAGIAHAMRWIEVAFPGQFLTVVSPLAEGADRLVVQQVMALPGARISVVLPMDKEDYLTDFATADSKQEFLRLLQQAREVVQMPPAANRDEAYEAVGQYVLDHCDVLIAVWDGKGAQGVGGTGGIVAEARRRNMPIAWIQAGNRAPKTGEPTTLGEEQGKVIFENFPT